MPEELTGLLKATMLCYLDLSPEEARVFDAWLDAQRRARPSRMEVHEKEG